MTDEQPVESEEPVAPPAAKSWRDDPRWKLIQYAPELWSEADAPDRPTDAAELANPPIWASLYDGGRLVAVWKRPTA